MYLQKQRYVLGDKKVSSIKLENAVSYIESKITVPKISYPMISLRYDIQYIEKYSKLLTEILHKNINKIFQLYTFNVQK